LLDNDRVQVLAGVTAGESVVTSGQFLLDSESNLKEAVRKMIDAKTKAALRKEDKDFFADME
jgi:Cu(I)/Ag(I) efflux system membrane fusion protein/cobalt-zinc-cadmium efflux system membrane fusion protein